MTDNSLSQKDDTNNNPPYDLTFWNWLMQPKIVFYILFLAVILGLYIWLLLNPNFEVVIPIRENMLLKGTRIRHGVHLILIITAIFTIILDKYTHFLISDHVEKDEEQAKKEGDIWYFLTLSTKIEKNDEYKQNKAFIVSLERLKKWIKNKKQANTVITQFLSAWIFCWVGWALLYIVLISFYPQQNADTKSFHTALYNGFNNFSSLMILVMFLTLNSKTIDTPTLSWVIGVGLILCVSLGVFEAKLVENNVFQSLFVFSLISGLFGSISMAAFFGRLNSRFKRIPVVIIFCLHLYAAIQVLYVFEKDAMFRFLFNEIPTNHSKVFENDISFNNFNNVIEGISTFMFGVAFFIKIILLLIVRWVLNTARFSFFVIQEVSVFNSNENDKSLIHFIKHIGLERYKIFKNDS
jgi:hypothetical protein